MREKIVLRRRTSPKIVTLPNGTTFTARYIRIARKQLIGKKYSNNRTKKKKRNTLSSASMLKRMKKNKRKQSGEGLAEDLGKMGLELGSKALNSSFGRKPINKGIDSIPNIFKYGVSKIKNKNVKRAMSSDIANMVVDEAQNKINKRFSDTLF